ncbi:MAG: transcriptional regulator FtrA [Pseudomonadota bacterium]
MMPETPTKPTARRHRVAIMAYDRLCTFEFGIALEVFALPRPELSVPWYDCRVFAWNKSPLRSMGGLKVTAPHGRGTIDWADTIIVPGWSGVSDEVPMQLRNKIARAYAGGTRLVSICSGVFVLAAAGILDNRRATTHWRYVEQLQAAHPTIKVEGDALYVDEGDILTSAGSAAGLDLCLHIVRQDHGSKIANSVARRLVLPTHREGGQTQFIPTPVGDSGTGLAELLDWLREHLEHNHTVASMAAEAGLSERTFVRRFRNATGTSPHAWLTAERVRRARDYLETTKLSTNVIAEKTGFVTPETFRHHFRRAVGIPPTAYRLSFQET